MDCRGLRPRNFEKEKQSKLRTRSVKQSTVSQRRQNGLPRPSASQFRKRKIIETANAKREAVHCIGECRMDCRGLRPRNFEKEK